MVGQTYPCWTRLGPELLCPAAPDRFPAGAGGTDGPSPGPGNRMHIVINAGWRQCGSLNYLTMPLKRLNAPACIGQRGPDRRTPSSRWLCRPAPAPAPAPACGTIWPCRSPAESGRRCPGCCRPSPPRAGFLKSANEIVSLNEAVSCVLVGEKTKQKWFGGYSAEEDRGGGGGGQ